jgi:ketosteroid isomerase-like protein
MKKRFVVMALVVLGSVRMDAQPLAPSPQFQASMDLAAAFRTRDAAKVMELLRDDVVLLPPGRDLVGGRREVEALLKQFLATHTIDLGFSSLGSSGADKLGFDVGQYELTLKPEASGAKTKTRGKYLAVFKQDEQERWRLGYLSWNSSEPAAAASPTPTPSPTPSPTAPPARPGT